MATMYFAALVLTLPVIGAMEYSMAPGIFKEELQPSPIFYEAFIPILYRFQHSAAAVALNASVPGCSDENFRQCRVLQRLIAQLGELDVENFAGNCSRGAVGNSMDFCTKIRSHFQGLHVNNESFQLYLQRLGACPLKGLVNLSLNNFGGRTSGDQDGKKPGIVVTVDGDPTTATAAPVETYLLAHLRWQTALSACVVKRIPTSLIPSKEFSSSLDQVEESASKQGYKLVIPMMELGVYFKLPLTDCVFTDGALVVRILVPVRRAYLRPRFYKLHTIPFILKESNGNLSLCEMANLEGHQVADFGTGYYLENGCSPGALCLLGEQTRTTQPSTCESVLLQRKHEPTAVLESMRKNCRFECKKVKPDGQQQRLIRLPIVRRLGLNKLVITGVPNSKTHLRCSGKLDETLSLPGIGALEITLSCGCSLAVGNQVYGVLPSVQPSCGNETQIFTRIPTHFFSENFIKSGAVFDGLWTEDMKNPLFFTANGHRAKPKSDGGTCTTTWLWIVIVFQTLAVAGAFYYVRSRIENIQWEYKIFSNATVCTNTSTAALNAPRVELKDEVTKNETPLEELQLHVLT